MLGDNKSLFKDKIKISIKNLEYLLFLAGAFVVGLFVLNMFDILLIPDSLVRLGLFFLGVNTEYLFAIWKC